MKNDINIEFNEKSEGRKYIDRPAMRKGGRRKCTIVPEQGRKEGRKEERRDYTTGVTGTYTVENLRYLPSM